MLSGEGNENSEKTTIGLISKKKNKTLHVQPTFFGHFFAVVLYDYKTVGPSYIGTKHFPESKTRPESKNTSKNPKHVPKTKSTSMNPKYLQNPKHVWITGKCF